MKYSDGNKVIRIVPGMSNDDISTVIPEQLKDVFEVFASKNYRWTVYRDRCFFAFDLYIPETRQRLGAVFPGIAGFGTLFNAEFISHLKSIIHLPGLRGNPSRTYLKNAAGPDFPGTFENYVASTLSDWQQKKDSRLSEVGGALEEMGLTWKVRAEPVDDTQVELKVGRLPHSRRSGAHDLVSIADVSIGVSQVLPVVVALIVAKSGQIVYLEQPEIHLHPRAQRKLAHVINNAVKRNVVVVVETHSSLLLREIQTLVAKSELSPEKVALHWFQRQDDGRTVITSADLDENGAYGPWPEDFDEVELKAEKDYLDAVESREARG